MEDPGAPRVPRQEVPEPSRVRLDAVRARRGLDAIAAGWAVAVVLGLFSFRGASPGFVVGAALVAAGLVQLAGATDASVAAAALLVAAVAGLGAVAGLVGVLLAAAGSSGGVRACDAVVLLALVVGAFGVVATMARLTQRARNRRLCLRWRRAGAVLVLAVAVTVVAALLAVAAGRPASRAGAGFWHAPFGHELPTPVAQVLLGVLAVAAGAAALALALAVEATRGWLERRPDR